ncbi:MAG: hypothetical protein ABJG41_09885 [Cyclobacteriaceae bacterium]
MIWLAITCIYFLGLAVFSFIASLGSAPDHKEDTEGFIGWLFINFLVVLLWPIYIISYVLFEIRNIITRWIK